MLWGKEKEVLGKGDQEKADYNIGQTVEARRW